MQTKMSARSEGFFLLFIADPRIRDETFDVAR